MIRTARVCLIAALIATSCSGRDDTRDQGATSSTTTPPATSDPARDDSGPEPAPSADTEGASIDDLTDIEGLLVVRNDSGDLVVISPTGKVIVELASGGAVRHSQPTWSHEGDTVAWSAIGVDGPTLEIADLDGSLARSTPLPTPAFFLSWSPNDTWLGALRPVPNNIELLVIDAGDGTLRPIGAGQPFYFDWQSDDALVAAVNGTTLVEVPAVVGPDPSQFSLESPLGAFQAPAVVDPERSVVALEGSISNDVVLLDPGAPDVTVGRANGPVALSPNPVDDRLAVLVGNDAPQSQVIAYQFDAPADLPSGQVSIIDLGTGDALTDDTPRIVATQWSPDGSILAMLQASNDELRWILRTADGAAIEMTPFVPSVEFATAYLPFADQYNRSTTWWSPDSRAIVFAGEVSGEVGVWVDLVDDDKTAVLISSGDIALWSPG